VHANACDMSICLASCPPSTAVLELQLFLRYLAPLTYGGVLVANYSKETKRRVVRWLGVVAAVLQLGSIYAAARAIHTSPHKQRLVAMDLRCASLEFPLSWFRLQHS
jgi:hypothetical protein